MINLQKDSSTPIVAYAIALQYGYGFYKWAHYNRKNPKTCVTLLNPVSRKVEEYQVEPDFAGQIRLERRIKTGWFKSHLEYEDVPLYIVSDGASWYEFLTGIRVHSIGFYKDGYFRDQGTYQNLAGNLFEGFGPISNYAINPTPGNPNPGYGYSTNRDTDQYVYYVTDEVSFSKELSKYTEAELKFIAGEVRKRVSDCEKWLENFAKLRAELQIKWEAEKKATQNFVDSTNKKFGQY